MLKKNPSMSEKMRIPKVNWSLVSKITLGIVIVSIFVTLIAMIIRDKYDTSSEQVSKVKVGMTKEEVFETLGEEGWSNYDERGFQYGYNFKSPGGGKKTFWVTIKNDVVTDISTN